MLAKDRRTTLSRLVEDYLRYVTAGNDETPPVSMHVQAIAESLEMPSGLTYDDLKEQYLLERHLGAKNPENPD